MSDDVLTKTQCYLAMFDFLSHYYDLTKWDGIGALLSEMSFLPDGRPADPATEHLWNESVARAMSGEVDAQLRLNG